MAKQKKTIIMLSAKRCGSTALFTMFQRHPEVGVCHVDQKIKIWEPNFWNLAAEAIEGKPTKFLARFRESHPFLQLPETFSEELVFRMWDQILDELGPVVFDKTPQYLGKRGTFDLLGKYMALGNDVRLFAFIRDPRDAITSQYELWRFRVEDDSPGRREVRWLRSYRLLEELQAGFADIPLFRYEDFSAAPACYAPMLFRHCGISVDPDSYSHIRPTSVGRYSGSILPRIRTWKFSEEFKQHLEKYGYPSPQLPFFSRVRTTVKLLKGNIGRELWAVREKRRLEMSGEETEDVGEKAE